MASRGVARLESVYAGYCRRLTQGKTALVLVPDIALTDNSSSGFVARFASQIAVLHTGSAAGERSTNVRDWPVGRRVCAIGARSRSLRLWRSWP